jgi:muramidase (phage lysozyme)
MKNIEAEKDELVLQNESGTYAIIPANKREEVKRLLSEGCYDCIDRIVESLPKASDYAEDGSLFPGWDKVKTMLNPYNWGVSDYTDKYSDKDAAFSAARKAGEKEYLYNGIRYTTDYDLSQEEIPNKGDRLVNTALKMAEKKVDITRPPLGRTEFKREYRDNTCVKGVCDIYKSAGINSGIPDDVYDNRTFAQNYKDYGFELIDNKDLKPGDVVQYYNDNIAEASDYNLEHFPYHLGVAVGNDEYVSDGSKFDPMQKSSLYYYDDKERKDPFLVYRKTSKFFTDKELSELDPNKKNFNTLALQKELANRGYDLSESIKKDGSFDGIWGDETKSALLDYQSKNNKIKAADGLVIDPPADIDIKLLNTIGTIESNNQYDILFGGKRNPQLTDMSISELLDYQSNLINEQKKLKKTNPDQYVGSAAGRYQFIPNTIKGLVDLGIISLDDKFNSETQDKMAIQLLNESGLNRYKKGELSADEFADNLSKKWAGLPYNNDKSYYDKDGVNKALISRKDFMAVFADEINNDIAKQEAIQEEVIQEAVQEESASKLPVISLQEDDLSDYGIKNDVLQPITQDTMQKLLNPTELVTEIAEPEPNQLSIPDEVKSGLMSMLIQMKYISPGEKLTTDTLKMFVYENLQNLGNFPTDDQSLALITTELNK